MPKASRLHHSDEFGKIASNKLTGVDAPLIGAASMITVDGMVERESGVTPAPPLISVRAVVIGLVVMFILGAVLMAVGSNAQHRDYLQPIGVQIEGGTARVTNGQP